MEQGTPCLVLQGQARGLVVSHSVVVRVRRVLGRGHRLEGIIGDGVGRGWVVMGCSHDMAMSYMQSYLLMRILTCFIVVDSRILYVTWIRMQKSSVIECELDRVHIHIVSIY